MDSINKQQPEENHKDLQGTEAGKKIKELAIHLLIGLIDIS